MHYEVFEQMEGAYARRSGEDAGAYMTRIFSSLFAEDGNGGEPALNEKMEPVFAGCSAEAESLTLEFPVRQWMLNPGGTLHGGIIAAMLDMAMGLLARYWKQTTHLMTSDMNVSFLRPVPAGARFTVTAYTEKTGRRLQFMRAEGRIAESGKLAATAQARFI